MTKCRFCGDELQLEDFVGRKYWRSIRVSALVNSLTCRGAFPPWGNHCPVEVPLEQVQRELKQIEMSLR